MLSFGETRELHLRRILGKDQKDDNKRDVIIMKPGSLVMLGPETNDTMEHSIVTGEDERVLKREGKEIGTRISLVLRNIKSCLSYKAWQKRLIKAKQSQVKRVLVKAEKNMAKTESEKTKKLVSKKRKREE
jgi:hypothetical protein